MTPVTVLWQPQPRQAMFIRCPTLEVVFGGARGGGKSDAVLGDWMEHSHAFGQNARALAIRRSIVQLDELIERAKEIYLPIGAQWHEQKKTFIMPAGGILRMRYLDNDDDAALYQGHSYTRLYVEELTNFPSFSPIAKLIATLRSAQGIPCQMKATCNPGGVGHNWVKTRYIDPAPAFTPYSDDGGETFRTFIPSRLQDNEILMRQDPGYVARLKRAGNKELVRAWLEGDWDIVIGAFFPEFDARKHVIPAARVPDEWRTRYRAMDWGSARPYAVLWIAVADGHTPLTWPFEIPRGALVVYREMYGWAGEPNVGLRWPASRVGQAIRDADMGDELNAGLCRLDPSAFATNGGPSIAEMMARQGAWFHPADNRRVAGRGAMGGWNQIRDRLLGEDGRPMLYIMDNCRHLMRTLPTLPMSSVLPDDVDTNAEDHAADALRYGCMARPYIAPAPAVTGSLRLPAIEYAAMGRFQLAELWKTAPSNERIW
jgi:hypothetical protein